MAATNPQDVHNPTSVVQVTARERENQAMQLRITGATFDKIGETLGVSGEAARQAVKRALKRTEKEKTEGADILRELERQRLERLILAASPQAMKGSMSAIDQVRRLSESLRKLLGLDLQGTDVNLNVSGNMGIQAFATVLNLVYGAGIANADPTTGNGATDHPRLTQG